MKIKSFVSGEIPFNLVHPIAFQLPHLHEEGEKFQNSTNIQRANQFCGGKFTGGKLCENAL